VLGLVLALLCESARVLLGSNFHVVLPGRVFRCAQLSGERLQQVVSDHGIRTVVNLRGSCYPLPWYLDESRATHRLKVAQEDVCFSAGRLPSVYELRRLIEIFDSTDYPILLHCRRGADRTGLAATVVLLLQPSSDLNQARRQMSVRYGHVALGRPAHLDTFFDLYAEWLRRRALSHSSRNFRRWALEEYCPGVCRCSLQPLAIPDRIRCGEPALLAVRVTNTSAGSWRLCAGNNAGVHIGFILWDSADRTVATGRSGLFDAEVVPGESIELQLALPVLKTPGRYHCLIDMVEESQGWFHQMGSEPLEKELEVCE
jgi:hypothetical protein